MDVEKIIRRTLNSILVGAVISGTYFGRNAKDFPSINSHKIKDSYGINIAINTVLDPGVTFYGANLSLFTVNCGKINGVNISLFTNNEYNKYNNKNETLGYGATINGANISCVTTNGGNINGLNLNLTTGPASVSGTNDIGANYTWIRYFGGTINGADLNLILDNSRSNIHGIQASMLGNIATKINGIQIAPLGNIASKLNGVQIGLWNTTEIGSAPIIHADYQKSERNITDH
ncbi:MAG: hypothetical protein WC758_00755 [Candidatus Woesearchaeota archaeon]|jgi:hypothetical protein